MTILYTRWRLLLLIVSSKDEFCSEKKSWKNSSKKLCLLLSYIVQKSLHFDEIFLPWKKSVSEFSYPHAMDSIYLA